ncbi:MaoC family dehydratase [Mycobacterium sp.]|uniref:MaoC family dehydratase n=1 Tax=Mycobacterium sp. TaxID=1785 RepID=UPI0025E83928|nr:MaoC family dehydratase [Mycobacterium sp.]
MRIFAGLDDLAGSEGTALGPTPWLDVDQHRIDAFADATDDRQWIHVDPQRAATGPYGSTIAHGLLTLSLLPRFMHELYRVDHVAMAINYGFDKIRFLAPVPVGSRLRASAVIFGVSAVDGGVQVRLVTTIELAGSAKPAAVIESIVRYLG